MIDLEKSTYELLKDVSDEYGPITTRDKLCVVDHTTDNVASICIPGGAHSVLDMLEDRGLRVVEIPRGRSDCHKAGHYKRVYVEPIGRRREAKISVDIVGNG